MGSIEKLDCSAAVEEDQPVWLTLEVPSMVLTPLQRPVVAVLNKYEIVVTGGYGFDYKLKSDIAILNTRNDRVRKVTKGHHSLQCYGSQAANIDHNKVLMLAQCDRYSATSELLKWKKGSSKIITLKEFSAVDD